MEYFNNHKKLFLTAIGLFLSLTILVAIIPAIYNQDNNAPLPGAQQLSGDALKGKAIYVANGCVGCHTRCLPLACWVSRLHAMHPPPSTGPLSVIR